MAYHPTLKPFNQFTAETVRLPQIMKISNQGIRFIKDQLYCFNIVARPIPTIIERKFHITPGESLSYSLPVFSESDYEKSYQFESKNNQIARKETNYILIGSPIGADITKNGVLHWRPQSDTDKSQKMENEEQNDIEFFVIKVTGNCEEETALIEVSVHIDLDPSKVDDSSR